MKSPLTKKEVEHLQKKEDAKIEKLLDSWDLLYDDGEPPRKKRK